MILSSDEIQDLAECIFTNNWTSIDELKKYIIDFLNECISGISVLRWTRYDGTPETLPRKHITVFLIRNGMEEIIFSRIDSDGDWMERQIAYDKHVGDLWAYLPEPPEEMK